MFRVVQNKKGQILIWNMIVVIMIFILMALLLDFGRIVVAASKLQLADDAGSLAGATAGSQVQAQVQYQIVGFDWCTDNAGDTYPCNFTSVYTDETPGDSEHYLIDMGGWTSYTSPPEGREDDYKWLYGGDGGVITKWLTYPSASPYVPNAYQIAMQTFKLNWPSIFKGNSGSITSYVAQVFTEDAYLKNPPVSGASPYYPSVAMTSTGWIKDLLGSLTGLGNISITRDSQSSSAIKQDLNVCDFARFTCGVWGDKPPQILYKYTGFIPY